MWLKEKTVNNLVKKGKIMKKIAIIDDEREILDILERFLKRSDKFIIDTFSHSHDVMDKIKNGYYDLVLLDIMMPKVNGLELLDEIKSVNKNVQVIMMTAYSTMDKVIHSNKVGAEDYLTKPFVSLRDVENKVLDRLGL